MLRFSHHIDLGYEYICPPDKNTILFDTHTITSHLPIVDRIGTRMWEAQWMCDMGLQPSRSFAVILPESANRKVKEENLFSRYDTVNWFLTNIHPPCKGIGFSVYFYPDEVSLNFRYNANTIWPLAEQWRWKGDGDYITVHKLPKFLYDQVDRCVGPTRDFIEDIENKVNIKVVEIDYTIGEEKIFNLLKHSKCHITYHGGMYFSTGMIGIPTLCYGFDWPDYAGRWDDKVAKGSSYGQGLGNVPTKIHQYDWETRRAIQDPQTHITHTKGIDGVLEFIKLHSAS